MHKYTVYDLIQELAKHPSDAVVILDAEFTFDGEALMNGHIIEAPDVTFDDWLCIEGFEADRDMRFGTNEQHDILKIKVGY